MNTITLPMLLALAGAILSAAAAFVANQRQNQEKTRSSEQRAKFESELRQKSEEITELNKKIAASVTGGDNYCHIEFVDNNSEQSVLLAVVNDGRWPAYDVVLNFVDVTQVQRLKMGMPEHIAARVALEGMFQKALGTVAPGQAVLLNQQPFQLPASGFGVFEMHVNARNGTVAQIVKFQRINGRWTFASKASLLGDSRIIWQQVSTNYPQSNIDDADWWK